jgi:hypothetical protein
MKERTLRRAVPSRKQDLCLLLYLNPLKAFWRCSGAFADYPCFSHSLFALYRRRRRVSPMPHCRQKTSMSSCETALERCLTMSHSSIYFRAIDSQQKRLGDWPLS